MVVGVAWYMPEQWERLLEISVDRDELESNHAEWERNAVQSMKKFAWRVAAGKGAGGCRGVAAVVPHP